MRSWKSHVSADIDSVAVVASKKRHFQFPRIGGGRGNGLEASSKDDNSGQDEVTGSNEREAESPRREDEGRAGMQDESEADETQSRDDMQQTSSNKSAERSAGDSSASFESKSDEQKDNADSEETSNETQQTNQTRPAILFMAPPHQHPHSTRPMPFPPSPYYMPPSHPHHPSRTRNNKRTSLLSSILSAFIPSNSNSPPNTSPFAPQPLPNPYQPNNNNEMTILLSTILSLLLRLALLTFTTHILDLFGLGSHSDAFLPTPAQHYTFERVNDRYKRDGSALAMALNSPPIGVGRYRWKRIWGRRRREVVQSLAALEKEERYQPQLEHGSFEKNGVATLDNGALYNKTVIIIDVKPDARVGNGMAEHLRDTVSFIIEHHRDHVDKRRQLHNTNIHNNNRDHDSIISSRTTKGIRSAIGTELEILLLLDSPGGTVQDYGLASSHLTRLRDEPHITLSICVDRIAASGGYMMACQATPGHLFAAPFAMVGSIGVLMETVNINDILNRYGVKPLTIKAGKHKAPLKTLGEVSDEEMEMAQKDAEGIHVAFQQLVLSSRPNVVASKEWIEKVCTGSVFLGKDAVELGLVDRVLTSDEYVAERIAAGDRVLRLIPYKGPQFGFKLSPLDLLLSGMDAEGRAKIREVVRGAKGVAASMLRVGGAVGMLNFVHRLAMLNRYPALFWTR
ncbi:hypothetical protein HJC23_000474 [Cyclotella cryptica]|uniref:Peptidase S49 domain-containing protein n=1 Tax=Cyclotella cryptica TaxID=29204 RepID=A0ABD3QCD6_9STRA